MYSELLTKFEREKQFITQNSSIKSTFKLGNERSSRTHV